MRALWTLTRRHARDVVRACTYGFDTVRDRGPGAILFWFIALCVGVLAGFGAVGFRLGIEYLQEAFYGADDRTLATHLATLPWYWIVAIPVLGGAAVGVILQVFTPDGRARSVSHVIEGAALSDGRVDVRFGLASSLASMITLSTGGSTGREGPVVHLGAVISSYFAQAIRADGMTGRDLLGCAAAAAVSASFNAPIAGALFALEVVLRHFAVHAFAPIVIASVAGAVIARLFVGDVTEFVLPLQTLDFYQELPAFMILGLVSGLVAAAAMWGWLAAEDWGDEIARRLRLGPVSRPALAGLVLGLIALGFPHIIGVGYETTSRALTEGLTLREAVIFAVVKAFAVGVTIAGRMGGGVFSPSLMLGALTGLAFGVVATGIFPAVSGTVGLYALAGMGAVAAGVLGAPISTTLIIFELTGDWQAGLAVMVAVSLASALSTRLVAHSYFLTQIERRGLQIAAGPQEYLLATISAGRLMVPLDESNARGAGQIEDLVAQGAWVRPEDTLDTVLPLLERTGSGWLPVARAEPSGPDIVGTITHLDALKAYTRALAETAREEHS